MLQGLALTPPVIGRISIGKVIEKNGMRLPEKDDEFTVTSQVQNQDGWVNHPLDKTLRKTPDTKLRSIPVRLLFDDPDLSLRANYTLFERKTGRQMCVGNGETCKRLTVQGLKTLPCPTPDTCELAVGGKCKSYGRLNVRIGDEDELGTFIFRTTGYNSIRTLSTRLKYFHAVSGGLLSTLPLELRLRGKSTSQSHRTPIYYVDLTVRSGMTLPAAIAAALVQKEEWKALGFDQAALDEASRQGFAAGVFEESAEEVEGVLEEFFPEDSDGSAGAALGNAIGNALGNTQGSVPGSVTSHSSGTVSKPGLADKLNQKVLMNGAANQANSGLQQPSTGRA